MKVILLLSLLAAFNCIKMNNLVGGEKKVVTKPSSTTKENSGKTAKFDIKQLLRDRLTQILKKPVIYLYPEEPMDVSVQLDIKDSKFSSVYPRFNGKHTWKVHAEPNGDLIINNKKYPYLFWEAQSYKSQETNEGFLVTDENAEAFLEEKLKILGLNEKEQTDFITFWLPVLLRNKLSLCTFQNEKFFKNLELNVTPKPDSLIRVFLTIKKLDEVVNVKEQKLKTVERTGFTVVEWGGSNF
jgi:hypothetical protein